MVGMPMYDLVFSYIDGGSASMAFQAAIGGLLTLFYLGTTRLSTWSSYLKSVRDKYSRKR